MSEWEFEGMRMLLGNDVIVVEQGDRPAVALKLQDMDEEITPAEGLDVYLDNLINRVPRLAVCFHQRGQVRGYRVLSTADIPTMAGAPGGGMLFSPDLVERNAATLLTFLRNNCRGERGTYWLLREEGSSVARLYDLSALASGPRSDRWKYMMAMLCYRFAMQLLPAGNKLSAAAVEHARRRELLQYALELLEDMGQGGARRHPTICASVHEQVGLRALPLRRRYRAASRTLLTPARSLPMRSWRPPTMPPLLPLRRRRPRPAFRPPPRAQTPPRRPLAPRYPCLRRCRHRSAACPPPRSPPLALPPQPRWQMARRQARRRTAWQ